MDFPPILILAIVWLLIGLPLSKLSKASKQQAAQKAASQTAGAPKKGKPPEQQKQAAASAAPKSEPFAGPTVMQPTISLTGHDDSIYMGSMNAVTGEGYDPCHDEQLAPLTEAESVIPAAEPEQPGLQLSWTGSDIVRGLVMKEILDRR